MLKVMFILLILVLLVLHALHRAKNLFVKIEAAVCAYIFMFLLLPLVERIEALYATIMLEQFHA